MSTLTFTLYGDVNVRVMVSELADGTLQFDLSVLDDTGSIGDLNAVYFDLADDSLTAGLTAAGDDVTGMVFDQDSVTKVDNYTTVNGDVVKELGRFDAGVQFGTQGIGTDDIRETSFVLSHSGMDLSIDMLLSQDFALRLTSVGAEDGSRDDSTKIGGEAPPEVDDPAPEQVAVNDLLIVDETETFDANGAPDVMMGATGPQISVLENDQLTDEFFFETVEAVNGDPAAVNQIVTGSNGGQMIIRADGTVDFSANGEFDGLNAGDTATTEFTYMIEGGSTATVTVIVNGLDDLPPPDGDGSGTGGDPGIDFLG